MDGIKELLIMDRKWEPRKLSIYNAEKIREYYDQGATQNWLATKFGVSKQTIKSIVQRKTYKQSV